VCDGLELVQNSGVLLSTYYRTFGVYRNGVFIDQLRDYKIFHDGRLNKWFTNYELSLVLRPTVKKAVGFVSVSTVTTKYVLIKVISTQFIRQQTHIY